MKILNNNLKRVFIISIEMITYAIFTFYLFTTIFLVRGIIKRKKRVVGYHYNRLDDENNINSFLIDERDEDERDERDIL